MLASPSSGGSTSKVLSNEEYVQSLQKDITQMVSRLTSGKVCVIVSVENNEEYIYAQNVTNTKEQGQNGIKESQNSEYAVINGQALLQTVTQPKVRGIAVACINGDDPILQNKIINLLSCAYGISSAKICVAGY